MRSGARRRLKTLMLPNLQDLKDLVAMLLFFVGLRKERARFDRFDFRQKSEYWALVWGTAVMAVTGGLLWFNNWTMKVLPKMWIDFSRVVHFYEAVLATLAILIWHFYMVIFDPDVYPMNWAWLDGKVTEEQYIFGTWFNHTTRQHPLPTTASMPVPTGSSDYSGA